MELFPGPLAYLPAGGNAVFVPCLAALRTVLWSIQGKHDKNTDNDSSELAVTQCASQWPIIR